MNIFLLQGVGYIVRKLANVFTPTIEMGKDENGNYMVKAQTWAKTLESHFELGKEFDEDRFDGKKCKVYFWLSSIKI